MIRFVYSGTGQCSENRPAYQRNLRGGVPAAIWLDPRGMLRGIVLDRRRKLREELETSMDEPGVGQAIDGGAGLVRPVSEDVAQRAEPDSGPKGSSSMN